MLRGLFAKSQEDDEMDPATPESSRAKIPYKIPCAPGASEPDEDLMDLQRKQCAEMNAKGEGREGKGGGKKAAAAAAKAAKKAEAERAEAEKSLPLKARGKRSREEAKAKEKEKEEVSEEEVASEEEETEMDFGDSEEEEKEEEVESLFVATVATTPKKRMTMAQISAAAADKKVKAEKVKAEKAEARAAAKEARVAEKAAAKEAKTAAAATAVAAAAAAAAAPTASAAKRSRKSTSSPVPPPSSGPALTGPNSHWVRRSVREPGQFELSAPKVLDLLEDLTLNNPTTEVLKLKKWLGPDTISLVMDCVLDAMMDNTVIQALYIQNFALGMRDSQMLKLLKVLQQGHIWSINIGETYKVSNKTWELFREGLKGTNVTHMYASEHTISSPMKLSLMAIIRDNRKKHKRHCDPGNLAVIKRITHCWWNPINAGSLKPHLALEDAVLLGSAREKKLDEDRAAGKDVDSDAE